MNFTQITSADLKQIAKLLEQKEALQARVAEIDAQLAAYGSGETAQAAWSKPALEAPTEPVKRRKISAGGRARIAAAQKARWAKLKKTAPVAVAAKPSPAAKVAKARRTLPGQFKDSVIGLVTAAGKSGISVKDIAARLGVNPQRIYAWFNATGKNVKQIKKVAPATYGWTE